MNIRSCRFFMNTCIDLELHIKKGLSKKVHVVASEAKQSASTVPKISGLLRRYAPRKDVFRLFGQPLVKKLFIRSLRSSKSAS